MATVLIFSSLQALTSGTENIAIGKSALLSITTGNSNVAIGQSTMSSADGGEDMNVTVQTPTIQCGMCQKNIEVGLSKLDGVGRSTVDLASKTTKVSFESKKTDLLKIDNASSVVKKIIF